MKPPHLPDDDKFLLDAILSDRSWQTLENSLRRDALSSLRAERVRRKVRRWVAAAGMSVVVLTIASAYLGGHRRPSVSSHTTKKQGISLTSGVIIRDFKEGELIALFPKGSCLIAEVDDRPTFIILNEERALQAFQVR